MATSNAQYYQWAHGTNPRFTHIDYEMIAEVLRAARAQVGEELHDKTANEIMWELAKMFKADNPRFEELKFIAACTESV